MDTERIAVLLSVLEAGSLSAAAEKLGYTPSGVSRQISALEGETGLALLTREHRGVCPTQACLDLLEPMRQMLAAEESFHQRAAALLGLERGTLRIGCAYGSYLPQLSRKISCFSAEHPGIHIELENGSSSMMCGAIREGKVDFALISHRAGDFRWVPLRQDALLAVVPAEHPLSGARAYPVNRFESDDFVEILPQQETDNSRLFAKLGLRPNVRFACDDSLAALSMVEAGLGVSLVNALLLDNWSGAAVALPLDPPQWVEIGFAIPPGTGAAPAATAFLKLFEESRERTGQGNDGA